ncbi:hypothetical protein [Hippea alviniae]|uniref:hypothetical protein n=1 Tax=Hippea alviniae TaxID=1279027 RepID=UPI0003B348C3|nr:hypothetical protein [Hippea alviniae]
MINIKNLKAEYITNEKGEKFVILPLEEFSELIEDLEDLRIALERRDEPTISHDELLRTLKEEGVV